MKAAPKKLISLVLTLVMCAGFLSFFGTARVSAAQNVEFTFNDPSVMSHFTNANNLSVSYSDAENSVMMAVTGGDPYVLFDVESMGTVSADTYKYVVVTYRTPTTNSSTAVQTELFMCAGAIAGPTGGYSVKYNPANGYKYRSQTVDMSGESYWTGTVHAIRFDAFANANTWDCYYLASVTFCSDSASAQSAAAAKASEANGDLDSYSEAALGLRNYDLNLYTQRYWKGNIVFNESYYPLCNADGSISPASLLYDIKRVVSVRSGSLGTEYKYGVDWTVTADGKFQVIASGSIPKISYSTMYNPPSNQSHPRKGGGSIFAAEGATIHNSQLSITYTHDDAWDGFVPDSKVDLLPNTYSKLQNKQHITAVFFGDSITYGCNASGLNRPDTEQHVVINVSPYMPIWSEMVVAGLKAKYGYNDITHVNTAKGGTLSTWGVQEAQSKVAAYSPDLVFIGFGMNDGAGSSPTTPAQFKANIQSIINTARAANPNAEFVLISSIVANPETTYDGIQEQYLPVLQELEDENTGVALADVMSSHKAMLEIKKYSDMTANNVNHPNDFFIRQYAQTMLTTLSPSDIAETRADAVRALNNYVSLSDYRPAEQAEIQQIIASGTANINAASTAADVRAALAAAKALIDEVKTAAEYEAENLDYTNLKFNSAAALTTISRTNSVSYALNSSGGYTTFSSTGDDPYFCINYDPGNLSANTYKYVTVVYNVPSTTTNTSNSQVFFAAGSNTGYAEARSVQFLTEKGAFAYKVIDLSSASYWSGKIHSIRFDTFSNYVAGDSIQLHSVRLFASAADAAAYGSRTAGILSGNYTGITESVQFDTESELSRITSVGGTRFVGDANGDGVVNLQDYSVLKQYIASRPSASFDADLADANRDGAISIKDVLLLKKHVASAITLPTIEGATVTVSYSSQYKGAALDPASSGGTVVIDVSDKSLSADDFAYISLAYQNRSGAAQTVTVSLMRGGAEVAGASQSFTAPASSQYVSQTLDFSAIPAWSGDIDAVKLSFDGSSFILGGLLISDTESAASSKGATKALSLNRMTGAYTPVTGQTVVPLNDTTTMATFANYSSASNGAYAFNSALTFTPDRQPDEKFDRVSLKYTSSTLARGVITYNVNGTNVSDEFFLEAASSEATFNTLIPGYFNGETASEIVSVTVYPVRASSTTFSLRGVYTEDMANYSGEIYLQNANVKVGVLLTMGGGISYYEQLNDGDARYSNLLNRYDVGRLIQQSYYGINTSPYVMGDMGGTPWRYNPVQGGDVHNNPSQIVDLQVTDSVIYVKTRPMDWGHNGHKTPSYMENWYTLYNDFTKVDNRFVDFSTYTHNAASQELPAFYTVSALGTFCMYNGSSPWTGGAYASYPNLHFWSGEYHNAQTFNASSEGWYAWIDGSTGFGVGLYVPNVSVVLAGRFGEGQICYGPDENPTNYFAPLRTMTLKAGKPLTYSYLICAGQINSIRTTFQNNRTLINNSALAAY